MVQDVILSLPGKILHDFLPAKFTNELNDNFSLPFISLPCLYLTNKDKYHNGIFIYHLLPPTHFPKIQNVKYKILYVDSVSYHCNSCKCCF